MGPDLSHVAADIDGDEAEKKGNERKGDEKKQHSQKNLSMVAVKAMKLCQQQDTEWKKNGYRHKPDMNNHMVLIIHEVRIMRSRPLGFSPAAVAGAGNCLPPFPRNPVSPISRQTVPGVWARGEALP